MWLGEYFTNNVKPPYKERPDECPLFPVPDHGRLIDGDYAEKDLIHDCAYAAAQMVKNYPTIIPASTADKEETE